MNLSKDAIATIVKTLVKYIKAWGLTLQREITVGGLNVRAMALVYTTLLSLVPLLAVSFSVLKAFGVHNQLKPFLLEILSPLGEKGDEIGNNIVGFVQNIQVGVLGSIGIVMLIYSVVSMLEIIKDSFNHIWRTVETRVWLRRVSDYLSILLIGPVLVFSALGVMASMESHDLVQRIIAIEPLGTLYYLMVLIIPYALIIAAFTFVYIFMPSCRINFKSALIGGILGGLGWKAVGWGFGTFVVKSASYNAIYSSFAILILFMFWIYVSWLTMLLGGAISFYHQHPSYLRFNGQCPKLSHNDQETLGFLLMYWIGRAYFEGKPPRTVDSMAESVALPWEAVLSTLQILEKEGLLVSLHSQPDSYIPARALEKIRLQEIYRALRYNDKLSDHPVQSLSYESTVTDLVVRNEELVLSQLGDLSLRDLMSSNLEVPHSKPVSVSSSL